MRINQQIKNAAVKYLRLAKHFRPETPSRREFRVHQGPEVYPAPGLHEFDTAVVLAGEWFVIANGEIVADAFVQTPLPPYSAYLVQRSPDETVLLLETPLGLPVSTAFLLGGCLNYAHWLLDFLPRIRLNTDPDLPILVNQPLGAFQLEALRHIGVESNRLVELGYPGAYLLRRLVYPTNHSSLVTPPLAFQPAILDWLRTAFSSWFASGRSDRRLFLSRATQTSRRLLNHEEIIEIARTHGFEIVACEQLSFPEQVRLFSQAAVIAGPRGAAFANMAFATSRTRIIEISGPRFERDIPSPIRKIAALLGQPHTRIEGRSNPSEPLSHASYETYTIDPQEFLRLVRN